MTKHKFYSNKNNIICVNSKKTKLKIKPYDNSINQNKTKSNNILCDLTKTYITNNSHNLNTNALICDSMQLRTTKSLRKINKNIIITTVEQNYDVYLHHLKNKNYSYNCNVIDLLKNESNHKYDIIYLDIDNQIGKYGDQMLNVIKNKFLSPIAILAFTFSKRSYIANDNFKNNFDNWQQKFDNLLTEYNYEWTAIDFNEYGNILTFFCAVKSVDLN